MITWHDHRPGEWQPHSWRPSQMGQPIVVEYLLPFSTVGTLCATHAAAVAVAAIQEDRDCHAVQGLPHSITRLDPRRARRAARSNKSFNTLRQHAQHQKGTKDSVTAVVKRNNVPRIPFDLWSFVGCRRTRRPTDRPIVLLLVRPERFHSRTWPTWVSGQQALYLSFYVNTLYTLPLLPIDFFCFRSSEDREEDPWSPRLTTTTTIFMVFW